MNCYFVRLILVVGLVCGCSLISTTVFSKDSNTLRPIGSFSDNSVSNDHAYGYQVMLWANGNKLFGHVTRWNGGLGGHAGDIEGAGIHPLSGNIKFSVIIRQTDVKPVVITNAIFKGKILGKTIVGSFTYQGKGAKFIGDDGVVKVVLKREKHIKLLSFAEYNAWKKSFANRYKYED